MKKVLASALSAFLASLPASAAVVPIEGLRVQSAPAAAPVSAPALDQYLLQDRAAWEPLGLDLAGLQTILTDPRLPPLDQGALQLAPAQLIPVRAQAYADEVLKPREDGRPAPLDVAQRETLQRLSSWLRPDQREALARTASEPTEQAFPLNEQLRATGHRAEAEIAAVQRAWSKQDPGGGVLAGASAPRSSGLERSAWHERIARPLIDVYRGGSDTFKKEVRRKGFHMLHLAYLLPYFLAGYPRIIWVMASWTAAIAVFELLRLKTEWMPRLISRVLPGVTLREKEARQFSGLFFSALGLSVAFTLFGFSPALAVAAVLYLLADAVSPLVGLRIGILPYKVMGTQRSVDGTLAGFAAALLIGLALGFGPLAAFGAAIAFSLVDTFPVKPDDNLWLPIAATAALFLFSLF